MLTPTRHFLCLLALLATTRAFAAAPDEAKYRPPFVPHFTAGQFFSYNADADYSGLFRSLARTSKLQDDGTSTTAERTLFDMSSRFSVVFVAESALARQVYKNGSLREVVFLVSRCQVMQQKESLPPFIPLGGTLTVRRQPNGQLLYTLDGKEATPELAAQLRKAELPPTLIPVGSMLTLRKQNNGQVIFALDGRIVPSDISARLQEKDVVQTLLPPGSILVARKQKDGQVAFAVNGEAADLPLAEKLSVVIDMGNEDATKDDLLGPPQPISIGTPWGINLKAVLNSDLPQCFPGVNSVVGDVRLLEVRPDKSGALRGVLDASYSLVGVQPPFKREFHAKPSTVSFKVTATTPVAGGPGEYDLKLKSLVHHEAQTGDENIGYSSSNAEFSISIEQSIRFILDTTHAPIAALTNAPPAPDAPSLPPGLSAANIYRPPIEWIKKSGKDTPKPTDVAAVNPAPKPVGTAPAPAPQPKPAVPVTPFIMPNNDVSPFSNARDPLSKPIQPNSK